MKSVTSKHHVSLRLPDGRWLLPFAATTIADHLAGHDRLRAWRDAGYIDIADVVEPEAEQPQPVETKRGRNQGKDDGPVEGQPEGLGKQDREGAREA